MICYVFYNIGITSVCLFIYLYEMIHYNVTFKHYYCIVVFILHKDIPSNYKMQF